MQWFNIESCLNKLVKSKYARFCDDPNVEDEEGKVEDENIMLFCINHNNNNDDDAEEEEEEDGDIPVTLNFAKYLSKHSVGRSTLNKVREYGSLVGKRCAPNLLYYI